MTEAGRALIAAVAILIAGCAHSTKPLRELRGLKKLASAIAWSHDGSFVAAATPNGAVLVWNVNSGSVIATTTGYRGNETYYWKTGIAFSPDDSALAYGGDGGTAFVWNFRDGIKRKLAGLTGPVRT